MSSLNFICKMPQVILRHCFYSFPASQSMLAPSTSARARSS
uniref:Uncharacterized protein n=1 Tax=Myoviridae sp. ct7113 TaxID=2825037 RepID=A0A8S5UY18_9CAUD|nr:MAG TPA: hypothetical protein [Myoviridae sp. ct7113]